MSPDGFIAVIPEEYYRKPAGVQFKKTFRDRADAVSYAQQCGYRLIIACEAEGCYDVMCDPEVSPGPKRSFELVEDRGELVAVPRGLTKTRRDPVEPPIPRKMPWSLAKHWIKTQR